MSYPTIFSAASTFARLRSTSTSTTCSRVGPLVGLVYKYMAGMGRLSIPELGNLKNNRTTARVTRLITVPKYCLRRRHHRRSFYKTHNHEA